LAGEIQELYRGTRAQAMGGAYVGLADDEQAIFLNPAGLAGNKKYTFHYAVADLSISNDLITSFTEGSEAFRNLSGDSLNVIMGKNVFGQAQVTSSLLMPNFGIAILMDGQAALIARDKALPTVTLGYQNTNGIQMAYGASLTRGFRQRGEFRVGVGAKLMWRRGGYHPLGLTDVLTISRDKLAQLTGNYGRGIGVDLGTQYIFQVNQRVRLSAGLAMTDIGDTNFGNGPSPVKSNLAMGLAASFDARQTRITLAYDYKHMMRHEDWRKKNHVGAEIAMPFVSVFGGINQVFLTYGAAVDIFIFRLTAAKTTEERGAFVYQNPEPRWSLKLALKFNL
jgi:hypothetical protein